MLSSSATKCSIVPISRTVGVNRILPSVAIPHLLGDPSKSAEQERLLRRQLVDHALSAVETEIVEQTVFE